ncbi:hypothetical protein [Nocardia alni]|uniref:hypothetical protein n=1 Tax=Nocardia alni TaxID=2815723 RepID=UPI001C212A03|nr:hypothetical protein [Nocardia alni]
MTNGEPAAGRVWKLWRGGDELARMTETEVDWPWIRANIETSPGFEPFRQLFEEQLRAADDEDWDRLDEAYSRIRAELSMTFPDGSPVAEFLLHVHGDGTAGWRCHDEPFGD